MRVLGFERKQETTKTLAGKVNRLTKFRTALLYKIKACNDFKIVIKNYSTKNTVEMSPGPSEKHSISPERGGD